MTNSPFLAGTNPTSVAVDSTDGFLYAANAGSNNISAYSIDLATGELTEIDKSPFIAETQPVFVVADPNGFIYAGNQSSKNISGYSVKSSNGVLNAVSGSPFSVNSAASSMVIAK